VKGGGAVLSKLKLQQSSVRPPATSGGEANSAQFQKLREQFAKEQWDKGTFNSVEDSIAMHLDKHGHGRSLADYTSDALEFTAQNKSAIEKLENVTLASGKTGKQFRLKTDVDIMGNPMKKGSQGILITDEGKIVSYQHGAPKPKEMSMKDWIKGGRTELQKLH
jgi:hypothetical protein